MYMYDLLRVYVTSSLSCFPGAPNNVSLDNLKVKGAESGDNYQLTFTANFTDYSDVPVTKLKYVINQTNFNEEIPVRVSEMNWQGLRLQNFPGYNTSLCNR